jgi:2-keto-4-pentenoate hydratase/2-oxohepta-3-ene-1,7-dioic acid hydratase in catechol pathway
VRLARFSSGTNTGWGFVDQEDSTYVRPASSNSPSLVEALGLGPVLLADLYASSGGRIPIAEVTLHAPVDKPSKVICIGLNYADHARESGMAIPERPLVFCKFPSSIVGPYDDVELPPESKKVDWEAELVVVMGRSALRVTAEQSVSHIGGFMVANDVSARDVQADDGQFVRAKSFTSFCPVGPWVTTLDEVEDYSNLSVQLRVNGALMQNGNTSDLIANVSEIVSFCSQISMLEAGDIILTGTPAGVGAGMNPQQFLQEGDLMETTISGLGSLRNKIVTVAR